jgi:hypothetical protein
MGGEPLDFARMYVERGADAVSLDGPRSEGVGWLAGLEGMRSIISMSPLKDDSAVWACAGLEEAVLANGSKQAARLREVPRLRFLQVDWRPGLESMAGHEALRILHVWRTPHLGWLDGGPALRVLKVTGRRRSLPLSLDGARFGDVEALVLDRCLLASVGSLGAAMKLRGVALDSVSMTGDTAGHLLEALSKLPLLEEVNLWRCEGLLAADVAAAVPEACSVTELS